MAKLTTPGGSPSTVYFTEDNTSRAFGFWFVMTLTLALAAHLLAPEMPLGGRTLGDFNSFILATLVSFAVALALPARVATPFPRLPKVASLDGKALSNITGRSPGAPSGSFAERLNGRFLASSLEQSLT